jgi:hypothetical protein
MNAISIISSAETTSTEVPRDFTDFTLGQLRCAALRSKIVANQIEAASAALSAGIISPEQAILILAECGVEVSS